MTTLFNYQSEFSAAFLMSMLHSLWIGLAFYLILNLLLDAFRNAGSQFRYKLSKGILFLFIFSVIAVLVKIYKPVQTAIDFPKLTDILFYSNNYKDFTEVRDLSLQQNIHFFSIRLYFAGIFFISLKFTLFSLLLKRKIRNGKMPEPEYFNLLLKLKTKLGIKKKVRLIYTEKITSPALFGFIKPVIIVPTGMFSHLPFQQVEAILLHELMHLKNLDFLVNLFQRFAETLFFFNPFLWLISKTITEEREKYCDDQVVINCLSPRSYIKALYNISLLNHDPSNVAIEAGGGNNKLLLNRIQRLLKSETMKKNSKNRGVFSALIIVSISIIITLSGFNSALLTIDSSKNKAIESSAQPGTSIAPLPAPEEEPMKEEIAIPQFLPDTFYTSEALTDTLLSKREKEKLIAEMEMALEELRSIDWEEERMEIEKARVELLSELPDQLQKEFEQARAEMEKIDKEALRAEMEKAKLEIAKIDKEALKAEMEKARLDMDSMNLMINEIMILSQEQQKVLQEQLSEIQNINFDELMDDFDFDFDFDINIDSIRFIFQESIENINIDEIMEEAQESIRQLEIEIKEMRNDIE